MATIGGFLISGSQNLLGWNIVFIRILPFKPLGVDNYDIESFTKNGFTNWKDGPKLFDDHLNTKNGMSHSH
jgi:hypothetical protein